MVLLLPPVLYIILASTFAVTDDHECVLFNTRPNRLQLCFAFHHYHHRQFIIIFFTTDILWHAALKQTIVQFSTGAQTYNDNLFMTKNYECFGDLG